MEIKRWRSVLALALGVTALLSFDAASAAKKPGLGYGKKAQGPFLDPKTNSYFELRVDLAPRKRYWGFAKRAAAEKSYNGRKGRLAIVKEPETLNFIRERFRLNGATWIGLQFYCKVRKAVWVTGEIQPLGVQGFWAPQWHRGSVRCRNSNIQNMPVYLTPEHSGGVFWQASGPSKAFKSYLVEYPAASDSKKETKTLAE